MSEITNTVRTRTIALGAASFIAIGGALALGASPAAAAPLGANAIALNEAAPAHVIDVRRRGRHHHHHHGWHGGWGKYAAAGLALGFLGGAFAPHWWHGGYGHYPYAYVPAYGYSGRQCWCR
jgi:hypothetical protein